MTTAVVYTSNSCPYCKMAIEFLREMGVRVTTKNVGIKKYAKEIVDKTNQMGIPVIIIKNQIIIGYDKTKIEEAL